MLENIAQKIALTTKEVIDHDILITDNEGKVLGSTDISRIGTFHQASTEIIKTGKEKMHDEHITNTMIGVKPGITLPIVLYDELIGTIGITGQPDEVKKYGLLAKKYAELFLKEELFHKKSFLKEKALQHLVQDIATYDLNARAENKLILLARSKELGYDLKLPRVMISVDLFKFNAYVQQFDMKYDNYDSQEISIQSLKLKIEKIIKRIFNHPQDLTISLESDKFIIFHRIFPANDEQKVIAHIREKCADLLEQISSLNVEAIIGISSISYDFDSLVRSYKEAWRAIQIGKKMLNQPGIYVITDYYVEDILLNVHPAYSSNFTHTTLHPLLTQSYYEELFQTIVVWCECNLNVTTASKKLNIHRNTLLYRIKKIEEIMQIDFQNFNAILKVYIAIKLFYLEKE